MLQQGKVFIETYGCQMNLADSETVMALLEEQGYRRADKPEDAGIILVNTCIVREHAQEKALSNISRFKRYKDNNSGVRVGVLGCMATTTGELVAKRLPFLDWILGPDAYRTLPELILEKPSKNTLVKTTGPKSELYDEIVPARREGVNAWVVITRGCENFCTYCVVPYARGPERHRPAGSILDEVHKAVREGYPQVTLLGQNVNSWYEDNFDFAHLLQKVSEVDGLKRVRFITSHPKDCSDALLEVMGSGENVCPELHLPVQSGSNPVLKRMGRKYTRDHYLGLVTKARSLVPDLLLSTDVILGFPGETEDDYLQTKELFLEVGFDNAYVYKYSERPGTAAAKLEDDVPDEIKVERLMEIGKIVRESGAERRKALIGKTFPVMVEGPSSKNEEERMGRTPAGHVVVFPGLDSPGEVVDVTLRELSGLTLRGERA